MDPDEFDAYLETLDPLERQKAMYDFGFQKANYVPEAYQGAYSPELSQQEFGLGQYTQAAPSLDYHGNVEPFSLDVGKDLFNWQQDMADLTADPVMAGYGGAGAFDPAAFAPVVTPVGEPLDLAGSRYVQAMAKSQGGYESYLAQKIAGGMTPGAAVADMWAKINAADSPDAPADVKQLATSLVSSLPPVMSTNPATGLPSVQQNVGDMTSPEGRAASTDLGAITTTANDLFEKMTADPVVGYTDPNTGLQYAGSTQEPSELAAHFAELGIPTPFESYLDPKWLPQRDPQKLQQQQDLLGAAKDRLKQAGEIRDQSRSAFEQLQKGWQGSADARQAAARPVPATGPPENPYNLSEGSMGAAQTAADLDWQALQESGEGAPTPPPGDVRSVNPSTGAPLLTSYLGGDADYDAAYSEWEKKNKNRLKNEAMQRGAEANRPNANPYVVTSGDQVVGTYNFGGTAPEQEAMGKLMDIVAMKQGYSNPTASPYDQDFMQSYESGPLQSSINQYQQADRLANRVWNQTSDVPGASAVGTAYAMARQGRTPMEDAYMQRAMGRATQNPYYGPYGP